MNAAHTNRSIDCSPQSELDRALAQTGAVRHERLIRLSQRQPEFAPVWVALAEEHLRARRREEAEHAARRAMSVNPASQRQFSPELALACAHMVPRHMVPGSSDAPVSPVTRASAAPTSPAIRASAGAGAAATHPAPSPATARPVPTTTAPSPATARPAPATAAGHADLSGKDTAGAALRQAMSLTGYKRRERLHELSRRHPAHGLTWLVLAEEDLAHRRVEEALVSLDRALALDPGLEHQMSPKLENARRYHNKEANLPHRLSPAHDAAEPPMHRDLEALREASVRGARLERSPSEPGHDSVPVSPMLARALELRDPADRLDILRELARVSPENPAVLFHLAIESAQAGHIDEARHAGSELARVSPSRYRELYELAESYWPSHGLQSAAAPDRPQPVEPPPANQHNPLAEARTLCLTLPESPEPAPSLEAAPWQEPLKVQAEPKHTQLLNLPPPPTPHVQAYAPVSLSSPRRSAAAASHWRAAGALAAGVAAGLVFVVLLVLVLTRTSVLRTGNAEPAAHERPAPAQQTVAAVKAFTPDEPAPRKRAP